MNPVNRYAVLVQPGRLNLIIREILCLKDSWLRISENQGVYLAFTSSNFLRKIKNRLVIYRTLSGLQDPASIGVRIRNRYVLSETEESLIEVFECLGIKDNKEVDI